MRNVKKILPRILILVVFVAALNSGVRYLYEPPTRNGIYTVNEIKETRGEVETLVLGSSLAHWGVDGNLLGEMLDSLTLNLATSAQPLIGSYYFLKEQSQINPIQRVFLGLHATTMLRDNNKALDVTVDFRQTCDAFGKTGLSCTYGGFHRTGTVSFICHQDR